MAGSDLRIAFAVDASGIAPGVAQTKSALSSVAPAVQSLGRSFADMAERAARGLKGLADAASGLARAGGASAQSLAGVAQAGGAVAGAAGAAAKLTTAAAQAMTDWASAPTAGAARESGSAPPTTAASSPAPAIFSAGGHGTEVADQQATAATAASVTARTVLQQDSDAARLQSSRSMLNAELGLETAHAAQVASIVRAGLQQQDADRQNELDRFRAEWSRTVDPLVSSFAHGLVQMAEGTRTFGEVLKGLGHQLLDDFIDNVVDKKIEAWLWGETVQTAQTAAGSATRAAVENTNFFTRLLALLGLSMSAHVGTEAAKTAATTAGSTIRAAISTTSAATAQSVEGAIAGKSIIADAAKAAAGAFQAIVGIPVVGPILAPAAAAAAFAAVAAFQGLVSAEGGYDIPFSVNPIAQLHPREMVLPAHLAERVRAMTTNDARAGDSPTTFNYTAHAYGRDADDIERVLAQHGQRLQRFIRNAARNNVRLGVRRA